MAQMIRKFLQAALGYGLVSLLSSSLSFLLLPLYTRLLTPADYGLIDVITTVNNLVVTLVVFGVDHALAAYFFDGDEQYRRRLIGTAVWVTLSIAFVAWLAVMIGAPLLSIRLLGDDRFTTFYYLTSLNVLVGPLALVLSAAYRLRVAVLKVNLISLATVCTLLGGNILFVAVLNYGVLGIALSNLVAYCLVFVSILLVAGRDLRLPFDRALLGPLYRAAAGVMPATLSWLGILNLDRLLLTQFVTLEQLGLYSLANKLATLLSIGFTIVWNAWSPLALGMAREKEAPQRFVQMFEFFIVGSTTVALGVGLFSREAITLISRAEFVPAAPYALVLMVFTGPLTFMAACFNLSFYISKRTYLLSVVNIAGLVFNIVLNLILAPQLGIWGAVIATVAAGLLIGVLSYGFSQPLFSVPYRWLRLAPLLLTYAILVGVGVVFPELHFSSRLLCFAGFIAVIGLSGLIPSQLIRQGMALLRPMRS
jgi:O-antigen/teichoic acid export membrane protein